MLTTVGSTTGMNDVCVSISDDDGTASVVVTVSVDAAGWAVITVSSIASIVV